MRRYRRVAAMLLFFFVLLCPDAMSHECNFDKRMRRFGPLQVMREVPQKGRESFKVFTAGEPAWMPIRIKASVEDLNDRTRFCTTAGEYRPDFEGKVVLCESEHILTDEKRNLLVNQLLPAAIQLHSDRLLVQPLKGLRVQPYLGTACAFFTIPTDHYFPGVHDADVIFYVAAGPTAGLEVGWAVPCSLSDDGRPVTGALNFGPQHISDKRGVSRAAAHEIAHALGFSAALFGRCQMLSTVSFLRGKESTLVVSSQRTLNVARRYFGCPTYPGMELEDEGGDGTAQSHWERRNAKDELMAGVAGVARYTALTMAAFEDMGFYRANWSMAEPMKWGRNSGCNLLFNKCLVNGLTEYPDMFCNAPSTTYRCTSDHLALGVCSIVKYNGNLPSHQQYFLDSSVGAPHHELTDYCPVIVPEARGMCTDTNNNATGSRFGSESRCVRGHSLSFNYYSIDDVCVEMSCRGRGNLYIRHAGNEAWYHCPEQTLLTPGPPFTGGGIVCPKYEDVCPTVVGERPNYGGYDLDGEWEPSDQLRGYRPSNMDHSELRHGRDAAFMSPYLFCSIFFFFFAIVLVQSV